MRACISLFLAEECTDAVKLFNADAVTFAASVQKIRLFNQEAKRLLQRIIQLYPPAPVFATEFSHFIKHKSIVRKHPEYPTEQDFQNTEIYLPSKPIIRPTDISQVVPIQLQQQVARSIRSNCSEMMRDCLSVLRDAYGFVNHKNGAHTAMGWQFANERARSHIFSAPKFSQGIMQCKPLQKHILYAASKSHTTTQAIYRKFMPDIEREALMMASHGVTHRARRGYKKVFPAGAWPGSDKLVEAKHQVFAQVKTAERMVPTADGWAGQSKKLSPVPCIHHCSLNRRCIAYAVVSNLKCMFYTLFIW